MDDLTVDDLATIETNDLTTIIGKSKKFGISNGKPKRLSLCNNEIEKYVYDKKQRSNHWIARSVSKKVFISANHFKRETLRNFSLLMKNA